MNLLIQLGFPLISIIFFGLLLRALHTGIQLADLPEDKKCYCPSGLAEVYTNNIPRNPRTP